MKSFLILLSVLTTAQISFAAPKEVGCVDQKTQQEIFVASHEKDTLNITFLRSIYLKHFSGFTIFSAKPGQPLYLTFDKKRNLYSTPETAATEVTVTLHNDGTLELNSAVYMDYSSGHSEARFYNCR